MLNCLYRFVSGLTDISKNVLGNSDLTQTRYFILKSTKWREKHMRILYSWHMFTISYFFKERIIKYIFPSVNKSVISPMLVSSSHMHYDSSLLNPVILLRINPELMSQYILRNRKCWSRFRVCWGRLFKLFYLYCFLSKSLL